MEKWWKYVAVGAGTFLIGGVAGLTGGLTIGYKRGHDVGYEKSEPEISIYDHQQHGTEGLCVAKNAHQRVCAYDANDDGAIDIVLFEDGKPKEVKWGEEKCLVPVKSLEQLTDEQSEQPK